MLIIMAKRRQKKKLLFAVFLHPSVCVCVFFAMLIPISVHTASSGTNTQRQRTEVAKNCESLQIEGKREISLITLI